MLNTTRIKILLTLLVIVLVTSGLLTHELYKSLKMSQDLDLGLRREVQYITVYRDVAGLTGNVRDYILFSDTRYLDEFRKNSDIIIKNLLVLYNVVSPSKRKDVEDLVESATAYTTFFEKELVPVIQSKRSNESEIKYLQLQNNNYMRDLNNKADVVTSAGRKAYDENTQKSINSGLGRIKILLILLSFCLLFMLYELFMIFKQALIRHVYLGKLNNHTRNSVLIVDRKGIFVEINKSASELFGLSTDALLNKNLNEIPALFPQLQNVTEPLNNVTLQGQGLAQHRITYIYAGRKLELVADYIPVFIMNRLFGAMMVAAPAEVQKDKHVLLDTLETERKRISIEIHDWIGRQMSTMIHSLDYILRLGASPAQEGWRENLKTLQSHCQNAAIEMRGIMNDIHPYLIDRVGLISALESYISTFERLNNIKVYILYQNRSLQVKKKDEIIIYRIIQETLTNVAKHSRATEVDIDFTVSHDTLKIEVTDNGGKVGEFTAGKGLWGMKERANLVGGDIIFYNSGSGFRVVMTVPVSSGGGQNGENQNNVD